MSLGLPKPLVRVTLCVVEGTNVSDFKLFLKIQVD